MEFIAESFDPPTVAHGGAVTVLLSSELGDKLTLTLPAELSWALSEALSPPEPIEALRWRIS